jgi:subtilisin-like proprotein convertase family protein
VLSVTGYIINGFAAHPDVVAVSACTSLNRKALYSNWGRPISVAAPSDNSNPVTGAPLPGRAITTTANEYYGPWFAPGKRYTNSFGGTSSAAPLVAGIAALVKSANPALTALDIKTILQQTADKIEDLTPDALYGQVRGTYQNGHSEWFGYGKVNAARAVQVAVQRLIAPSARTIVVENRTPVPIPDNLASGVRSALTVETLGAVLDLEVIIDITHPWIGDLAIALISPWRRQVVLQYADGRGQSGIRRVYRTTDTPVLGAFLNWSPNGTWTLVVADLAAPHQGTLTRWGVRMTVTT